MKTLIALEIDKIPKNCNDCRFCKYGTNSQKLTVNCELTLIGDNCCDNYGEVNWAIQKMMKECPFNKLNN